MPILFQHRLPDEDRLNCMEVWGGHGATDSHFTRPGLDVWIWSHSQNATKAGGGDLHLLSSCASGRITRMLLADICGFGPLFAEIGGELRDLMKQNVNSVQQSRIVQQMSRRLDDASQRGGFTCTMVSTYFEPNRSLTMCNAGNPPPLLFRAKTGEWSIPRHTTGDYSAINAGPGTVHPNEYQRIKMKLDVGDMVLSFSNALTECRTASGHTLGLDGLQKLVQQIGPAEPERLPKKVVRRIVGQHADNLSQDGAALFLCRATSTPVVWRDNVLALFRLLRPVSDKTSIGN